jgi:Rieske Fe-S protein
MVALIAPGALVAACSDGEPSGSATAPTEGGGATGTADGGKLLIVRKGDEVTAFNAACTHMGTTVQAPKDGFALCPNHGSRFSAETGAPEKGPATQPLPSVAVAVNGDQVVLA